MLKNELNFEKAKNELLNALRKQKVTVIEDTNESLIIKRNSVVSYDLTVFTFANDYGLTLIRTGYTNGFEKDFYTMQRFYDFVNFEL